MGRYWVIIVLSFFVLKFILFYYPQFHSFDSFKHTLIITQASLSALVFLLVLNSYLSKKYHAHCILVVLYIQSMQMCFSNFDNFSLELKHEHENENILVETKNDHGIMIIQNIFTVCIAVCNCFLGCLIIESQVRKVIVTSTVFLFIGAQIVFTHFEFHDISYSQVIYIIIAIVYTLLSVPLFTWITQLIMNDIYQTTR